MIRARIIIYCLMIMAIASCKQSPGKIAKTQQMPKVRVKFIDTPIYTYKLSKQRAPDCGDKPDSECSIVKIKYPVFEKQKKLNDFIIKNIINLLQIDDVIETSDLTLYSQSFISGYEQMKKHFPDEIFHYTLNSYAKVVRSDSSLTTIEVTGYAFQSGARGFTAGCFINWDIKANKLLTLNDIFINDYREKLTKIGEVIFRKDEKLSNTGQLNGHYIFTANKFYLNNNFSITPKGIDFLYNETEIKGFAYGQTELFIPYSQIKSLLRPNTVVAQYIK